MDKCILDPPLTEEELLAYIDGEAGKTVQAHLEHCLFCADKATRYRKLQTGLQNLLYRQFCPTGKQLADFEMGLIIGAEQTGIHAHLQECPHCLAEIETLRTFLAQPKNKPQPAPVKFPDLQIAWQIKQARHLIGTLVLNLANLSASPLVSVPVKGQKPTGNELYHFSVLPDEQTEIDANLTVYRQPDPELCEVSIQAVIPAEWPELSNLQITLKGSLWEKTRVTGAEDKVVFTDIPLADLTQLSFEIIPRPA